ncbi:MAG TPA: MlaE family lipid ABC transporter permease subunit [Stellaceae bacterium]|nr:MlaE family lipid ABC transporter permease subunit [Stellaceae bacterium]
MAQAQAQDAWLDSGIREGALVLRAGGAWRVTSAEALDHKLQSLDPGTARSVRIDLAAVESLDSAGAWLLLRTERELGARGLQVAVENVRPEIEPLLRKVADSTGQQRAQRRRFHRGHGLREFARRVGEATVWILLQVQELVGFLGLVAVTTARTLRHPSRLRVVSLVTHMERTGVAAMPIVGLISFLIGVVLAYQGADQLRNFGAEIYTVNLLGIGILRELGILLTSIIVAGRSGSAFTAEIGAMKVHEEVDAMRTLGLDPIEILVLPRLFALVLVLPLLGFYANMMGLLGGAIMSWASLGIVPPLFVRQLHGALFGWTFWLGPLKAPFFATVIAIIGCYQGLKVSQSAESVGRLTTVSVVESIFLVIVLDAGFSIVFSYLHV